MIISSPISTITRPCTLLDTYNIVAVSYPHHYVTLATLSSTDLKLKNIKQNKTKLKAKESPTRSISNHPLTIADNQSIPFLPFPISCVITPPAGHKLQPQSTNDYMCMSTRPQLSDKQARLSSRITNFNHTSTLSTASNNHKSRQVNYPPPPHISSPNTTTNHHANSHPNQHRVQLQLQLQLQLQRQRLQHHAQQSNRPICLHPPLHRLGHAPILASTRLRPHLGLCFRQTHPLRTYQPTPSKHKLTRLSPSSSPKPSYPFSPSSSSPHSPSALSSSASAPPSSSPSSGLVSRFSSSSPRCWSLRLLPSWYGPGLWAASWSRGGFTSGRRLV